MKTENPINITFDDEQRRVLRLFLSSLNHRDFGVARRQLNRELSERRERETNAFRLFYSSLTNEQLQIVQQDITFLAAPPTKAERACLAIIRARTRKPRA